MTVPPSLTDCCIVGSRESVGRPGVEKQNWQGRWPSWSAPRTGRVCAWSRALVEGVGSVCVCVRVCVRVCERAKLSAPGTHARTHARILARTHACAKPVARTAQAVATAEDFHGPMRPLACGVLLSFVRLFVCAFLVADHSGTATQGARPANLYVVELFFRTTTTPTTTTMTT